MKTKLIEAQNNDLNRGWDEMYQQGAEGKSSWGEKPPPFIKSKKFRKYIHKGKKVLELAAGDGRNTKLFVEWGAEVSALDLAPTAIQQLTDNFKKADLPCPMTLVASAAEIPTGPDFFDAVVCIDGFPQFDRPRRAMEEVHRVLKPNGAFLLNVFTPRDAAYGEGEQIGPGAFIYHATLFQFYRPTEFQSLFAGLFKVVDKFHTAWNDPPHPTFRPYPHRHDANIYILEKK
jgi:ubiquinone/menaquinone biosynthesis C-methylase UbiE